MYILDGVLYIPLFQVIITILVVAEEGMKLNEPLCKSLQDMEDQDTDAVLPLQYREGKGKA